MRVVVDTNIIFSSILKPEGTISDLILNSFDVFHFFAPSFLLNELDKHHDKLLKLSKLSNDEVQFLKRVIFKRIEFIEVDFIKKSNWVRALKLTESIDELDTPFVALSMELDAPLWTGDKKLINGLKMKNISWVFSTNQMRYLREKTDNLY